PGSGGDVRRIEGARLAAEEALGEIGGVPQVEVADLRALDADDAEKMPGGNVERAPLARRDDYLGDLRHPRARIVVERRVVAGQPVDRVHDDGFGRATLIGVRGRLRLGWASHDRQG